MNIHMFRIHILGVMEGEFTMPLFAVPFLALQQAYHEQIQSGYACSCVFLYIL